MYKHLYDTFKHWYHGGTIFFYGDPHFGELDSYKYRFAAQGIDLQVVDEKEIINVLDNIQINNINKVCHRLDTLVILGDVGNPDCVRKLKAGYKVLIMGNHDLGASNYKHLFDEVYEGTLQISPRLLLSHEPVQYPYCLNIHGHVHQVNPIGSYTEGIKCTSHYNCCAEQIGYVPVPIKTFTESGLLKGITNIHRETIDKATKDKKSR